MIAIPAIDLIDGHCVRLTEGVFDTVKVYGDDPAAVARGFAQEGAQRLHVVDLDAARGSGNNRYAIRAIRKVFPGILDVGGGVRSRGGARRRRILAHTRGRSAPVAVQFKGTGLTLRVALRSLR